jgi:signal transduction histidine kinase
VTSAASLPEEIASTAYYIANESVANVLKHAHARVASIRLDDDQLDDGRDAVRLTVHDDGRGGADASHGSGLAGIRARVEGVDGKMRVSSPAGGPTTIVAILPTGRPSRDRATDERMNG